MIATGVRALIAVIAVISCPSSGLIEPHRSFVVHLVRKVSIVDEYDDLAVASSYFAFA